MTDKITMGDFVRFYKMTDEEKDSFIKFYPNRTKNLIDYLYQTE